MEVPAYIVAGVREFIDRRGGHVASMRAGVSRQTLYRLMQGKAHRKTIKAAQNLLAQTATTATTTGGGTVHAERSTA